MIKDRPGVSVQPWPPHIDDQAWPFANIDEQTWITGSHEELQQRILVLTNFAQKYYQVAAEDQQLRQEIADLEEENKLFHRQTVSPHNSNTGQSLQISRDEIHAHILQEHAVQLWFNLDNGQTIPLHRGDTTYTIIGGNMEIRAAVPREGETLHLSEEEVHYVQQYSYQHLLEHYSQAQQNDQKQDAFHSDLRQQLTERDQHIEEQHQEISILRSRLNDALTRCNQYEQEKTERFYKEKHRDTVFANSNIEPSDKIVGLVMLEEINKLRSDPHEEVVLYMQNIAAKAGVSPSTVLRVNHDMNTTGGWQYLPGEKLQQPDGSYYTPISIKMQNFLDEPDTLQKPEGVNKHGGVRKKGCKSPTHPISLEPETQEPPDRFAAEYCRICDSTVIETLPGQKADADARAMIRSIQENRVFISEQLHNHACTVEAQKQDAFHPPHIYVDDIQTYETRSPYKQWCHMATDGEIEELHTLATQIGLKREWFKDNQYNLTPSKRKQAITRGAIAVSSQELIEHCHPRLDSVMHTKKQDAFEAQPEENTEGGTISCTTCHIPIDQAEDFYFTAEAIGYCYKHGPHARPQAGQRVQTPAGPGTVSIVSDCPILKRLRYSIITDQPQADGSHFRTFDLSEVHRL